MKTKVFKRTISLLLCMLIISGLSVPLTAGAAVLQDGYEIEYDNRPYDSLGILEDQYDLIEPVNNRFPVISPSSKYDKSYPPLFIGTYGQVEDYFEENGMTDGLPVVPPTKIKAEKFLGYSSYGYNQVVATVNGKSVKAYQVAANAIMAGCLPEHTPICIAFAQALSDSQYLNSLKSGRLPPMMYVNGPVARQIGIDNTQGMTTEEANISIARFMELALINLAGIKRTNAFGNVQPLVFSENDETCLKIGWTPHHVEKGYDLNDNVITATSFAMWGNNVTPATDLPEEIMKVIAWDVTEKNLGALGSASVNDNANTKRLIFITESVATALATRYKSKDALESALVANARRPLWMRTYAYYYANTGGALSKSFSTVYNELKNSAKEDARVTASPAWMNGITYADIDTVATMTKGNTDIIVTGDSSRNKTQVMPGGVSANREVELSDRWNSLVTSVNYFPIEDFYLDTQSSELTPPSNIPSVLTNGTYRILDPSNGATYLTRAGRLYFDSETNTLNYYAQGASAAASVVLDPEEHATFIAYLNALGYNSSFTVSNGRFTGAVIRFSSNSSKLDNNTVALTSESFSGIGLTLHANNTANSNAAGGVAKDGATVTLSDTVTSYTVNLDGTVVKGDSTDSGFVKLNGTTVTVDPNAAAGATAVLGADNGNGTYRTLTFVNGGDGAYTVTYNTAGTLSLGSSSVYLKGSFNEWGDSDTFEKTGNDDVVAVTRDLAAGAYEFKVYNAGTDKWYGKDSTTINDTTNRLTVTANGGNIMLNATGGKYEFKFELSTNKLSVYFSENHAMDEQPTGDPTIETNPTETETETVTETATETSTETVTETATEPVAEGKTAYLSADEFTSNAVWYAYTWDASGSKWVKLVDNKASGLYDNVIFARIRSTAGATPDWDTQVMHQTEDLTTLDGGTYVVTSWKGGADGKLGGHWEKTYTFRYLPSAQQAAAGYNFRLNYNDMNGTESENWHQYRMTATDTVINGIVVYAVEVTTADTAVNQLQYQVYSGDSWVSQKMFTGVQLSDYDNKIIGSDGNEIEEQPATETQTEPPIDYTAGDVNGDETVSIRDATLIQMYLADYVEFDRRQTLAADADGNGSVTINDATLIQKFLVGIVASIG